MHGVVTHPSNIPDWGRIHGYVFIRPLLKGGLFRFVHALVLGLILVLVLHLQTLKMFPRRITHSIAITS